MELVSQSTQLKQLSIRKEWVKSRLTEWEKCELYETILIFTSHFLLSLSLFSISGFVKVTELVSQTSEEEEREWAKAKCITIFTFPFSLPRFAKSELVH